MLKISANQNLPDGSLGHGNPLEQIWWYTKSWWHLAKFTAWVMPPCLAHWACLALCLASCTLSWPHLHMAWGHACYQWPGMTPLAVDECVMKESCLALTMGAPPACPGCCEKHPKIFRALQSVQNHSQKSTKNFCHRITLLPNPSRSIQAFEVPQRHWLHGDGII